MDPKDIRTLKLLEELDNDQAPSQRDLARSLGVSLGLVNSFLKRLVSKGYFKVSTIPKNRAIYVLTPKGAAEKTRLTYEYIGSSYRYYKDVRQRLKNLFESLYDQSVRKIAIYGISDLAEIAYITLQQTKIQFAGIFDDEKTGERFLGKEIQKLIGLRHMGFDRILVTSIDSPEQIATYLQEIGVNKNKIVMLQ